MRAPILHWFGGSPEQIAEASQLGAWFSVNAAMKDEAITAMPRDRILTETDFPYTRRAEGSRPGAVYSTEVKLATLWESDVSAVCRDIWSNLRALVEATGIHTRLSGELQAQLSVVAPS